nr:MAG TPA: hypothetical protein [Caudoviricetes sp.]
MTAVTCKPYTYGFKLLCKVMINNSASLLNRRWH